MATFVLVVLLALGTPIKWSKFGCGLFGRWVGYHCNFKALTIGLDALKVAVLSKRLQEIEDSTMSSCTECLEIASSLIWAKGVWDSLRPMIQPFYAAAYGVSNGRFRTPAFVKFAATYFRRQLQIAPRRAVAFERITLDIAAASDGSATPAVDEEPSHACVGGWFAPKGCTRKDEAQWFAVRLTPHNAPWAYIRDGNAQRCIASIELFGTLLLLKALGNTINDSAMYVTIPAVTDNQGNSAILARCFTTAWPSAAILAEIAATLVRHNADCDVSFVPRGSNQWSDDLANFRLDGFVPAKRIEFDLFNTSMFELLPVLLQLGSEMGLDDRITKYARRNKRDSHAGDYRALHDK